jgi:glycosyltransferase involved in cell wall biosynthesis
LGRESLSIGSIWATDANIGSNTPVKINIAYVTPYDHASVVGWSGLVYFIAKALEQNANLVHARPMSRVVNQVSSLKARILNRLLKNAYLRDRDPLVLRLYGMQTSRWLRDTNVDIVFCPGTTPLRYIETERPIAYWADASFGGLVGMYPEYSKLPRWQIEKWHALEKSVISRAAVAIYASEWAASTAIEFYGADSAKVHVVPFGANLEEAPTYEQVLDILNARPATPCRLLFLGADWHRKGGNIAVEIARKLNATGIDTELVTVGAIVPESVRRLQFVKAYPFLDKRDPARVRQLQQLIAQAHFLVLPTKAEAFGVVFAEANAFGVPCVASRVGGVKTAIRNDYNGRTFDVADVQGYCEFISATFTNPRRYQQLALSSYNEYTARLNWKVAGRRAACLLAAGANRAQPSESRAAIR